MTRRLGEKGSIGPGTWSISRPAACAGGGSRISLKGGGGGGGTPLGHFTSTPPPLGKCCKYDKIILGKLRGGTCRLGGGGARAAWGGGGRDFVSICTCTYIISLSPSPSLSELCLCLLSLGLWGRGGGHTHQLTRQARTCDGCRTLHIPPATVPISVKSRRNHSCQFGTRSTVTCMLPSGSDPLHLG